MNDAHRAVDGLRQARHYIRQQGRSYRVYQERMTSGRKGWRAAGARPVHVLAGLADLQAQSHLGIRLHPLEPGPVRLAAGPGVDRDPVRARQR